MTLRLNLRPGGGDASVGPHEEARSDDPHVPPAVVGLLLPGPVCLRDDVVLVGQEREREAELGPEGGVAAGAVRAHAPDGGVEPRELGVEVPELARLRRAAGRVVLRVEVDDGPRAAAIVQAVKCAVLVVECDPRSRVADLGHAHAPEDNLAGASAVSTTRSRPDRIVTAAPADSRTLDRPRAGPTVSGSSRSGYAMPRVVIPATSPANGSSVIVAPSGPGRARVTGPPSGPGAWTRKTRDRASSRTMAAAASAGWARSHTLASAWSSRGPPNAPSTVIRVAPRAIASRSASSASDSSLSVRARRIGIPSVSATARSAGASESRSPTRTSGRRPSARTLARPPSAATTSTTSASQPGQAASSAACAGTSPFATTSAWRSAGSPAARAAVVVIRSDRTGSTATSGGHWSCRLAAVPDSPLPAPTQRVIDAAARKGVTLDVHLFAESTHTAEEAAATVGAELGQIVKSLVFVTPTGTGGLEPILCLVSGPNRVNLARLAAVTGASDIRRARFTRF